MRKDNLDLYLADRLGITRNVSPLRMIIRNLFKKYPTGASIEDDWLIDVANHAGANIISRDFPGEVARTYPSGNELAREELIVALCLPSNKDRLQTLRLAAQLISRGGLNMSNLVRLIKQERVEKVIGSLAVNAVRVAPDHPSWTILFAEYGEMARGVTLLHWTRLAEPIPDDRHVASGKWRLVA